MLRLILVAAACLVSGLGAPGPASAQSGERFQTLHTWAGDGFDGAPRTESTGDTLRLKGGTIWAPGAHADFVLRFDYRPISPEGGGALLLRSGIDDRRERQSYEVVLDAGPTRGRLSGEGQALGAVRFESQPAVADPAAWIAVEVRADVDRLAVSVDGVRVSEAAGAVEGFGTIGFRGSRGGVELRAIQLAPIPFPSDIPAGLPTIGARFDTPPELTLRTTPRYTRAAMLARAQGTARLAILIEADGRVGAIRILEPPPHPDLEVAAVTCVRRWRFKPAHRKGEPVATAATADVVFRLK
jgi:TonB family protein